MPEVMTPSPDRRELKTMAADFIEAQSTMALATCSQNTPWAAPVYFAFYKSAFYFFSDPHARHILESLENRKASAAIYGVADTWREIRGIQMSGEVRKIRMGLESVGAIAAYLKKFQFTKSFFSAGATPDLDAFSSRFHVKLYKLVPSLVYYLDNSLGFGFRETIDL